MLENDGGTGRVAPSVIVLGGGVGGLSAAQELAERGLRVTVYEKRDCLGGKARSIAFKGSGQDGRRDLPGEHGFRFFPRFYRHVTDTMRRIPYPGKPEGVFGNLVETELVAICQDGVPPLKVLDRCPRSLRDLGLMFKEIVETRRDMALGHGELQLFLQRLWQVLTSCEERAFAEHEKVGWWEFIDAPARSETYRKFFGIGMTRSTVAARAEVANAKSTGDILIQLLVGMSAPGVSTDRVLCGPTSDVWIEPWRDHLLSLGVSIRTGHQLESFVVEGGRVAGVRLHPAGGQSFEDHADYYVAAVPVEVMGRLLGDPANAPLLQADPSLGSLRDLADHVAWMNGIQYFLRRDVQVGRGHCLFLDSPWAITAISQPQFWPEVELAKYGDGTVQGIISVDISNWQAPGIGCGPAQEATRQQIADEVWRQLKDGLNSQDIELRDEDLHSWFLDPDIEEVPPVERRCYEDAEPLYLSLADTWRLRPDAGTALPNLFLASDYVRNYVQLPTMEGANEAARRAVNGILANSGWPSEPCALWPLHRPTLLHHWRRRDERRFRAGRPWHPGIPLFGRFAGWSPAPRAWRGLLSGRLRAR